MEIRSEDTYFLDRDLAYQTALAHNIITLADGQKREQVCYYDGQPFELAPANLIHVPVEKFSEYFRSNTARIPTKVEPAQVDKQLDSNQLRRRLSKIITAVQQLVNQPDK